MIMIYLTKKAMPLDDIRVVDMIKGGIWVKMVHITIGSLLIYYMALPIFTEIKI